MERIPEPELINDAAQALAYHQADFSVAHGERVAIFRRALPGFQPDGDVLDIGCGSGDVLLRFARAFPRARFTGVDGSRAMLDLAAQEIGKDPDLITRVLLHGAVIPDGELPSRRWQLVMSHSMLHHLHRPEVLWRTIREIAPPGCPVFVADLRRPATREEAQHIVGERSGGEPEVLRRDFYNSLCAAFERCEVEAQLRESGLSGLTVEEVGDIHIVVRGRMVGRA
jgi:SAM-dependent methyltransferase